MVVAADVAARRDVVPKRDVVPDEDTIKGTNVLFHMPLWSLLFNKKTYNPLKSPANTMLSNSSNVLASVLR